MNLEDLMGEIGDPIHELEAVLDDLRTAETVETLEDFRANLESALSQLESVRASLKETLEAAKP